MKRLMSILLVGSMLCFLTSSCIQQPVQLDPDPDISTGLESQVNIFFSVCAIAAIVLTVVLLSRQKSVSLTPDGKKVKLIIHEEAPAGAEYIGDIQSDVVYDLTSVKNDLRNKAARMGGNLVVIDTFQSEIYEGKTYGYSGSGRAYYLTEFAQVRHSGIRKPEGDGFLNILAPLPQEQP